VTVTLYSQAQESFRDRTGPPILNDDFEGLELIMAEEAPVKLNLHFVGEGLK
jgi:hypothetical protein